MATNDGFSGVSNCYVFKSRLQEYAQKVGLPTPIYETIKEGPSHEPSFRSTVIVNDVRYDSLPGFFNRKAAEQSAAEVALLELAKSGELDQSISQPVHETGLCKNLLQEYAQKMNYAIPIYQCQKDEAPGRMPHFSCNVEIGGIKYIGAAARTKKEAEIKAARTALIAIQMSASELSGKPAAKSELTVLPCKKRAAEPVKSLEETAIVPKPKRSRFKKLKAKLSRGKGDHEQVVHAGNSDVDGHDQEGLNLEQPDASVVQVTGSGPLAPQSMRNCQEQGLALDPNEKEVTGAECVLASPPYVTGKSPNGHFTAPDSNTSNHETPVVRLSSMSCGDTGALVKDTNKVTGVSEVALVVNNSTLGQMEPSSFRPALNQPVESLQAGAGQA